MPRVVADQKSKFETDELFVSVRNPTEIVYTGLMYGTEEERRRQFLRDCAEQRLAVAFLPVGLNLELDFNVIGDASSASTNNLLDLHSDPMKVFFNCPMILNGVCVCLKAWLDRATLHGSGTIEFDPALAEVERQRLEMEAAGIHCSPTTGPMLVLQSSATDSSARTIISSALSAHQANLRPESNGGE